MFDKKQLLRRAHAHGLGHKFINLWIGTLDEVLEPLSESARCAEIGATGPEFLRLLHLVVPFSAATAVVLDVDGDVGPVDGERAPCTSPGAFVHFTSEGSFFNAAGDIDLAFGFELFSLIRDLRQFAKRCFDRLAADGVLYSTFCWHAGNPSSRLQVELREAKGLPWCEYPLDAVAAAFGDAGFEVGAKRLRLPFFAVWHPEITCNRFGSFEAMLEACENQTVLFSFRRYE